MLAGFLPTISAVHDKLMTYLYIIGVKTRFMEKLKYFPVGMLTIYLIKCLITGASPVDAAILAIFATLLGYSQYKSEEKSISELKNQLLLLKTDQELTKKTQEELRSHVSSMKIGLNMRAGGLSGKPNV